jgi:hypothetical protein
VEHPAESLFVMMLRKHGAVMMAVVNTLCDGFAGEDEYEHGATY